MGVGGLGGRVRGGGRSGKQEERVVGVGERVRGKERGVRAMGGEWRAGREGCGGGRVGVEGGESRTVWGCWEGWGEGFQSWEGGRAHQNRPSGAATRRRPREHVIVRRGAHNLKALDGGLNISTFTLTYLLPFHSVSFTKNHMDENVASQR